MEIRAPINEPSHINPEAYQAKLVIRACLGQLSLKRTLRVGVETVA